jgi:hypothetical protein
MSKKNEPPVGFPVGNTDPLKRGLGRTQKQYRKANKSGCLSALFVYAVLSGAFYAATALVLGLRG